MFSLFKRNKDKTEIPEWASFFNANEYRKFIAAVENYFYSKNVTYTFGDGVINTGPNEFGFGVLGLVNVAQVCKQNEQSDYTQTIKEHFDCLIRADLFDKEFKQIVHNYEQVKQYIGTRLYSTDLFLQVEKEKIFGIGFAGDVFKTLIFDLPDSISWITPDQADKWNKSLDELFETGIQNIRNKYQFDISLQEFGGFNIWFVQGDHFFTPNIVFDLNNHQKLIGSKGSLIGIPHRHAVIIYPIENIEVVKAINALIPAVNRMNEEGPGSISNNLIWYNACGFENLPYKIEESKIQFYPPESFVTMLNTLT
jgi:hypothetical protein